MPPPTLFAIPPRQVMLTIHNLENTGEVRQDEFAATGMYGEAFATIDKALDERTIGHNPERLNLMKVWGRAGVGQVQVWGRPVRVRGATQ
eukprot:118187-Chlamydomonas_euryale.AAC.1